MFDSSTASTTAATDTTVATIAPSTTTTVAPTTVPPTTSAPSTVLVPAAPGGSVHVVSTSGSDANAGTLAAPWRTFTRALQALTPGDALYARGGTYVERVNPTLVPASPTAPVLVAAYPGERLVVQGILWLHSPDYWTFDGDLSPSGWSA